MYGTPPKIKIERTMAKWTELFGDQVQTKSGTQPTETALAGKKFVGAYFSAHWCPPCRAFTPFLGALYEDMIEEHPDFELIFISSDRDQPSFDEYYGEIPFAAMPFANREQQRRLSEKFGIRGIPSLLFFNENGDLLTAEGRMWVTESRGDVEKMWSKLLEGK